MAKHMRLARNAITQMLANSRSQYHHHHQWRGEAALANAQAAESGGGVVERRVKWDYRGQRKALPLGPLVPDIAVDAYVAPNAVVCGQVEEKCVLHAAPFSPTGLPAETFIDRFVTIGAYSLLRSCHIEFESIIGQRCVLMEGSLVETHAILEAGSVLPPGRRIPSGELWAGNPARFVRMLTPDEVAEIPKIAKAVSYIAQDHASEFLPYSTAYLEVEKLKKSLSIPL
ncbi:hypothetical protein SUGI_0924280 [Cryptomeria japonica]|nr:hypothetical protein SUGI_0924280 [Cryptomeria japonica]